MLSTLSASDFTPRPEKSGLHENLTVEAISNLSSKIQQLLWDIDIDYSNYSDYSDDDEDDEEETDKEVDYNFKTTLRSLSPESAAESVFNHALSEAEEVANKTFSESNLNMEKSLKLKLERCATQSQGIEDSRIQLEVIQEQIEI
ncbi:unnamed protein product [Ambrosiozyma monospora]|uniref:Unnamed protein product n=1 Tax=Ambrosiozyma monospora TaxID=43982 RepID=A0ACB5T194_AMBMO|nr:unnamed protein product [Ambrosiozyma monospora]